MISAIDGASHNICEVVERETLDMEIGPDEKMPEIKETAKLIKIVEGEEVEKMDVLLSLVVTGGNYDWI